MRLKENLSREIATSFLEKDAQRIEDAANQLGTSRAEIIRVCVLTELPRLIDREKKRRKASALN